MTRHVQIYLDYFGYGEQDFIPCEITWFESDGEIVAKAIDVHHIYGRGKGMEKIEFLIGVSRSAHNRCHKTEKPYISKETQLTIHKAFMEKFGKQ